MFKHKYEKYKAKYLDLVRQYGGFRPHIPFLVNLVDYKSIEINPILRDINIKKFIHEVIKIHLEKELNLTYENSIVIDKSNIYPPENITLLNHNIYFYINHIEKIIRELHKLIDIFSHPSKKIMIIDWQNIYNKFKDRLPKIAKIDEYYKFLNENYPTDEWLIISVNDTHNCEDLRKRKLLKESDISAMSIHIISSKYKDIRHNYGVVYPLNKENVGKLGDGGGGGGGDGDREHVDLANLRQSLPVELVNLCQSLLPPVELVQQAKIGEDERRRQARLANLCQAFFPPVELVQQAHQVELVEPTNLLQQVRLAQRAKIDEDERRQARLAKHAQQVKLVEPANLLQVELVQQAQQVELVELDDEVEDDDAADGNIYNAKKLTLDTTGTIDRILIKICNLLFPNKEKRQKLKCELDDITIFILAKYIELNFPSIEIYINSFDGFKWITTSPPPVRHHPDMWRMMHPPVRHHPDRWMHHPPPQPQPQPQPPPQPQPQPPPQPQHPPAVYKRLQLLPRTANIPPK